MTILTKLSSLLTSVIELPSALHACIEMAREADYSRHEMDRLPSELNEELEQKQSNLDLWRNWAVSMSGLDDDATSWQLRDEIKRKLADDDGAQICGKLAARIVELEKELTESERKLAVLRRHSSDMENRVNELKSRLAENDKMIRDSRAANEYLTEKLAREAAKLATVEAELDREREARRRRKQGEEPAPKKEIVLELTSSGNGHPNLCLGMYVARDSEWRYLSPEDMQND